jgi:exodeoxyribonuclease VII small subunit
MTLEEMVLRLQQIQETLQSTKVGIDKSLSLLEEAKNLEKDIKERLEKVEKRINDIEE